MASWNVVGVGGKDREFWKEMTEWDIIVMAETAGEKEMGEIKGKDAEGL